MNLENALRIQILARRRVRRIRKTKTSNETRRMARAARGCPTRSVPACLRTRDWHAHSTLHPRPFGRYRRDRDRSSAPIVSGERPIQFLLPQAIPTDHRSESYFNAAILGLALITRRKKRQAR
jgi:hypothetical protein